MRRELAFLRWPCAGSPRLSANSKLRAKKLVEKLPHSRRYRLTTEGRIEIFSKRSAPNWNDSIKKVVDDLDKLIRADRRLELLAGVPMLRPRAPRKSGPLRSSAIPLADG